MSLLEEETIWLSGDAPKRDNKAFSRLGINHKSNSSGINMASRSSLAYATEDEEEQENVEQEDHETVDEARDRRSLQKEKRRLAAQRARLSAAGLSPSTGSPPFRHRVGIATRMNPPPRQPPRQRQPPPQQLRRHSSNEDEEFHDSAMMQVDVADARGTQSDPEHLHNGQHHQQGQGQRHQDDRRRLQHEMHQDMQLLASEHDRIMQLARVKSVWSLSAHHLREMADQMESHVTTNTHGANVQAQRQAMLRDGKAMCRDLLEIGRQLLADD